MLTLSKASKMSLPYT